MAYPTPPSLQLPLSPYEVKGYHFKQWVRSRFPLWSRHLGDDVLAAPHMPVLAIGPGEVVWAEMRPGSEAKRNWGGIVIIAHTHRVTKEPFYSLYGHLTNLEVFVGNVVTPGQRIGVVAEGLTPDNGWWKIPHLHFGIYVGPWENEVLPGYWRLWQRRTKVAWWREPSTFIKQYNEETR